MTPGKRAMDIGLALMLVLILAVPMLVIALWVRVVDGGPVLYTSERMKSPDTPFTLLKFRTMRVVRGDTGVSGGYKAMRITRTGRLLRRTRLDELPQLFNILKGDMSFVGPRPPLRRYVELRPDIYARVLQSRPGVTGLATLLYHGREEALLARCRDAAETEAVYLARCVPAKARLDLHWARHRSICHDTALILQTIRRVFLTGRPR